MEVTENLSGGTENKDFFSYLTGGVEDASDTLRFRDEGCDDFVDLSIQVVSEPKVNPMAVSIPLNACVNFLVEGGSGSFSYQLISTSPIGTIDSSGQYLAGSISGTDIVRVTDTITSRFKDSTIKVGGNLEFNFESPRFFVAVGGFLEPQFTVGTGNVDLIADSPILSVEGNRVIGISPGTTTVTATEQTIGCMAGTVGGNATATATVTVVEALSMSTEPWFMNWSHVYRTLAPGDLNGDGYPDAIASDGGAHVLGTSSGGVHIFPGQSAGLSTTPVQSFSGLETGGLYGSSIAVADFTGDGQPDLAIGAQLEDSVGPDSGAVYIYAGIPGAFFEATPSITIKGSVRHQLGASMATCDFNGDGVADLAIGALNATSLDPYRIFRGYVSIHYGQPDGLKKLPDQTFWGIFPVGTGGAWGGVDYSFFGAEMAAGDYNGDTVCDLAVVAQPWDRMNPGDIPTDYQGGSIHLFAGEMGTGLYNIPYRHWVQTTAGDYCASDEVCCSNGSANQANCVPTASCAPADVRNDENCEYDSVFGSSILLNDVNDDGKDDLIVGTKELWAYLPKALPDVLVFLGKDLPATPEIFPVSDKDADWTSQSPTGAQQNVMTAVADMNQDGLKDLIYTSDQDNISRINVSLGQISGMFSSVTEPSLEIMSNATTPPLSGDGAGFGSAFSLVGDLSGDGVPEFLVAQNGDAGNPSAIGSMNQVSHDPNLAQITPLEMPFNASLGGIGRSLAFADVTGDGQDDLIVGAPGVWAGSLGYSATWPDDQKGGAALLFALDDGTIAPEPTAVWDDYYGWWETFGATVSSAGDFNGDGREDFAAANSEDSYPAGQSSWPTMLCLNTEPTWDGLRWSCGDDIGGGWNAQPMYQVPSECIAGNTTGSVTILRGADVSELNTTGSLRGGPDPAFIIYGPQDNARAGQAPNPGGQNTPFPGKPLAGNFDYDGDGYSDIALGIPQFNNTNPWRPSAGAVALYRGRPETVGQTQVICTPDAIFMGAETNDGLGWNIQTIGDLNQDGCDDLVFSAPGANGWNGRIYLLYGWGSQCDSYQQRVVSIAPITNTGASGMGLAAGQDLDGDTLPDLVVGAPYDMLDFVRYGTVFPIMGSELQSMTHDIITGTDLGSTSNTNAFPIMFSDTDVIWGTDYVLAVSGTYFTTAPDGGQWSVVSRFGSTISFVPGLGENNVGIAVGTEGKDHYSAIDAGEVRLYSYSNSLNAKGSQFTLEGLFTGQTWRPGSLLGSSLAATTINGVPTLAVGAPGANPPNSPGQVDNGAVYLLPIPTDTAP